MKRSSSFVLVLLALSAGGCSTVIDTDGAGGNSPSTTSTSTSTSTSTPCGDKTCAADEVCKDSSGLCGSGFSDQLSCVKTGSACSDGEEVCGCDGKIYMSEGCATLSKVDIDVIGHKCTAPTGTFACGAKFCDTASKFCREVFDPSLGGGEGTSTFACEALPDSCAGKASCACLPSCEGSPDPTSCTVDAAGNPTLHCTAG